MNQNFNFMPKLAPMLFKRKILTNRAKTKYREKCNVGDIIHCFTGLRTKNCKKLGDGIVKKKVHWNCLEIPLEGDNYELSPLAKYTWKEFAYVDGFINYIEFWNYFMNHPTKSWEFICFEFEEVKS